MAMVKVGMFLKEAALQRVWDAVSASGTDDHILFLEHPELPEHRRRYSGSPDGQH
jgi:hypothetical protein